MSTLPNKFNDEYWPKFIDSLYILEVEPFSNRYMILAHKSMRREINELICGLISYYKDEGFILVASQQLPEIYYFSKELGANCSHYLLVTKCIPSTLSPS